MNKNVKLQEGVYEVAAGCEATIENGNVVVTDSRNMRRHYLAVLIQLNRYRRDVHVPALYRMPNPKEIGKAIDYAVNKIKEMRDDE